jgi:MFS family permease
MVSMSTACLLAMSVWFSASAVIPLLQAEWRLSEGQASWLTLAVQLGFVAGTLISALLNLPDIFNSRRLFAFCAVGSALANGAFALLSHGFQSALILRFLTGLLMAGVYPPAMKVIASWFRTGPGAAIGALIGALTLGKAAPYLVNAFGMESWRHNMLIISGLSLAAGAIAMFLVGDGPYGMPGARFDLSQARKVFANRGVRLASFGYFGHMWELYAMWTWMPVMIRASLSASNAPPYLAEAVSFLTIGAGAAGCIAAGILADRFGRTTITSAALAISGSCCVGIGFLFGAHPFWLIAVAVLWGLSVVADSAQFSTCVTELGDPKYVGTALTLQTCIGFLITLASIRLVPLLEPLVGWKYVFVCLVPGPIFGILAMLRLRGLPEAARIAHGRK